MIIQLVIKLVIVLALGYWLYLESKGRDYFWTFWTFIPVIILFTPSLIVALPFTIFMVIMYLVLRPKGKLEPCPHCNKKIHEILTICPFCRKSAKKECLQCHEPVPWNAKQCPFCKSRALTQG